MVEETAIRVQINAAKLAGQGIFGILQAVANMLQARQYGQQSIQSLNRQSQALASVELNDKTLPYVRRQLKEYSVDYSSFAVFVHHLVRGHVSIRIMLIQIQRHIAHPLPRKVSSIFIMEDTSHFVYICIIFL